MTQPLFIESPLSVFEGQKALDRLQQTNDSRYETEDGVVRVDKERWLQAQAYERFTWLEHNTMLTEDRNTFHREQFGNYEALPATLGKVLELGAGVFTNLQHILPGRKAASVTLVDPLAHEYRAHPHCTYKDGKLAGNEVIFASSPIEAWKTGVMFDLIVMVNTLPHCYDAPAVLDFISTHLNPGGTLVMGEFPRETPASLLYDVGHPIALKAHVLENFLSQFETVYRNGWYVIVKKPGSAGSQPETTEEPTPKEAATHNVIPDKPKRKRRA